MVLQVVASVENYYAEAPSFSHSGIHLVARWFDDAIKYANEEFEEHFAEQELIKNIGYKQKPYQVKIGNKEVNLSASALHV